MARNVGGCPVILFDRVLTIIGIDRNNALKIEFRVVDFEIEMNREGPAGQPTNLKEGNLRPLYVSGAAGFFLVGMLFVFWNLYLFMTFEKAEGVIASIGVKQTGSKTPATIYEMWVGFQYANRQIYTRAGSSIFYQPYNKGDRVTVYYDPQKPDDAFINTFATIWFFPMALFLIGSVSLLLAKPGINDLKIIRRRLSG